MTEAQVVWSLRIIVSAASLLCLWKSDSSQALVDDIYSWLLTTGFFNSVYFETCWVIIVYPLILIIPKMIDKIPYLDKYKLDSKIHWEDCAWMDHIKEAVIYGTPFIIVDTFTVKKYVGVDPQE